MNAEPDQVIIVLMTTPTREEAGQLADMLVSKHLAACVQIMPQMESVYRWQGKVERQREVLLIAKTVSAKFSELESEVLKLHSYETPEIVAFPLTAGYHPYIEWLNASVADQDLKDSEPPVSQS